MLHRFPDIRVEAALGIVGKGMRHSRIKAHPHSMHANRLFTKNASVGALFPAFIICKCLINVPGKPGGKRQPVAGAAGQQAKLHGSLRRLFSTPLMVPSPPAITTSVTPSVSIWVFKKV
jgi:hypothetical protein